MGPSELFTWIANELRGSTVGAGESTMSKIVQKKSDPRSSATVDGCATKLNLDSR